MLTPNNKTEAVIRTGKSAVYTDELKFITDLGRSLLMRVHPKKVAAYVAETLSFEIGSDVCAVVVELDHLGLISSAFGASNNELCSFLNRRRFEKWLDFMPPQISFGTLETDEFLIETDTHRYEYVSPLHINGEGKGALVAGFRNRIDCTESAKRLIDAAAQMTAMSINFSAPYESTINSSIMQAKEEHRRFTESVLDALPVSLYVIDRDYRIVMWNRHREIGIQGMPRDSVIGRNVFEVLARYPQSKLSREFQRAFETRNIERIEQRTTVNDGSTKYWLVSKVPMRDADTGEITTKKLPPEVLQKTDPSKVFVSYNSPNGHVSNDIHTSSTPNLKDGETQQILNALEQTGWHRGLTAELLGISSSTLYRRFREYDL